MANLKEQVQKKSLAEIEALIFDINQKMETETDLAALGKLNAELSVLREVHGEKLKASGRAIRKGAPAPVKAELKSFDDYLKSKKK